MAFAKASPLVGLATCFSPTRASSSAGTQALVSRLASLAVRITGRPFQLMRRQDRAMPRYRREEIAYFATVESGYLEQFAQLDAKTQEQVIIGLERIAGSSRVPKQEREIAESRAKQLRQVAG